MRSTACASNARPNNVQHQCTPYGTPAAESFREPIFGHCTKRTHTHGRCARSLARDRRHTHTHNLADGTRATRTSVGGPGKSFRNSHIDIITRNTYTRTRRCESHGGRSWGKIFLNGKMKMERNKTKTRPPSHTFSLRHIWQIILTYINTETPPRKPLKEKNNRSYLTTYYEYKSLLKYKKYIIREFVKIIVSYIVFIVQCAQ